jgi:hypothetical protein
MNRPRRKLRSLATILATFALMTLSLGAATAHHIVSDDRSQSAPLTSVHAFNEDSSLEERDEGQDVTADEETDVDEDTVDEGDQGENADEDDQGENEDVDDNDQGQDENADENDDHDQADENEDSDDEDETDNGGNGGGGDENDDGGGEGDDD